MERRTLGGTGMAVSSLTLGTMMLGAMGNPDHDESVRMIHTALDAGVNLLDIGIPFYVRGTIENPSFEPDPAGIAKGLVEGGAKLPLKVIEAPGNALKSLFGGR